MSMVARLAAALHAGVASPASIAGLHLAIKGRVVAAVADFLLGTPDPAVTRAPAVIDGWLAPKIAEVSQFPFVIIRPRTGTDTEQSADQNSTVDVDIIIGVYGDEDDTWFDVSFVLDALRADLGAAPSIAGTAFEQTGPLTWEIPEQQPRPQWFGVVKTKWTVPRARRVDARNPVQED